MEDEMFGSLIFVRTIGDKTILTTIVKSSDLEDLELESEHLYLCTGVGNKLTITKDVDRDISEESKGNSINGILRLPIWQTS